MTTSDFLEHINECTFCRLKPSEIHGVGVFAIRDIGAREEPFGDTPRFTGLTHIKVEEVKRMRPEVRKIIVDLYSSDEEYYYIGPAPNNIGIYAFMNHSEAPNVELSESKKYFITKADITKGEELLVNYKEYSKFENDF